MTRIESRANPRYRALKKLLKTGFGAEQIVVEGEKLIREAMLAGLQPTSVWSDQRPSMDRGCPSYQVPESMYRAVSPTKSGNAPIAVFETPALKLANLGSFAQGNFLLLDQVQEPGNAGTLVRAAAAFGFRGVLWHRPCVFPFHHACIRASAGSVFRLDHFIWRDDLPDPDLPPMIGTAADAGPDFSGYPWPPRLVLALGNEGHGLSPEIEARLSARVRIPMTGKVESINVAGAGYILMHHLYRQVASG